MVKRNCKKTDFKIDEFEFPFYSVKINDINITTRVWWPKSTEIDYLYNADENIWEKKITTFITSPSELNVTFSLPMYDPSNIGLIFPISKPTENLNIMIEPAMSYVR